MTSYTFNIRYYTLLFNKKKLIILLVISFIFLCYSLLFPCTEWKIMVLVQIPWLPSSGGVTLDTRVTLDDP